MARLSFKLASEQEDGALRFVLKQIPMPGNVALSFQREPSFFAAERAGALESQTMLYMDSETDRVLGFGGRSIRQVFVDGKSVKIGYLSMLRGLPEARGGTGLARGYRFLRSLHADGKVPFYFTTILDENLHAKSTLESGRGGLPVYEPMARLVTYLLPLTKARVKKSKEAINIPRGTLPHAVECLNLYNRQYQLAPAYSVEDFLKKDGMLPAFSSEHLYGYMREDKVVGTLGVWNQASFKQTVVASYSRSIAVTRPLYNAYAGLRGIPGLPRVGEEIRSVYGAFLSVKGNDPVVFSALLDTAVADWSGRGLDYLVIGFCEGHPLTTVLDKAACRSFSSTIYLTYWKEDGVPEVERRNLFHMEVATL